MTTISLTTSSEGADLLVIGLANGPDGPVVPDATPLATEQVEALTSTAAALQATGKADEVLRLPGDALGLPPLLLTGLGPVEGAKDLETLRRAAGAALRAAAGVTVALALPTGAPGAAAGRRPAPTTAGPGLGG